MFSILHNLIALLALSALALLLVVIVHVKRFTIARFAERIHGFIVARRAGNDAGRMNAFLGENVKARLTRATFTLQKMANFHRFPKRAERHQRAAQALDTETDALDAMRKDNNGIRIGNLPGWAYRCLLVVMFAADAGITFVALQVLHFTDLAAAPLAVLVGALLAILADKAGHALKAPRTIVDGWIFTGVGAGLLMVLILLRALYVFEDPWEPHPLEAAILFAGLSAALFAVAIILALHNDLSWPKKLAQLRKDAATRVFSRHAAWFQERAKTYVAEQQHVYAAFRLGASSGWLGRDPLEFPDLAISIPPVSSRSSTYGGLLVASTNSHALSLEQ